MPGRRTDADDIRALADAHRVTETRGRATEARIETHEQVCAERYSAISSALTDLKSSYKSMQRLVLFAMLAIGAVEIMGGHDALKAVFAYWGLTLTITPIGK